VSRTIGLTSKNIFTNSFKCNRYHLSTNSLDTSLFKKTNVSLNTQIKTKFFSRPLTKYTKDKIEKAIKSADLFVFLKGTPDEPEVYKLIFFN